MKRFLSILLSISLLLLPLHPVLVQDAQAAGIYVPVASGTIAAGGLKVSAVDGGATASGGAFVDLGDVSIFKVIGTKFYHFKNSAWSEIADSTPTLFTSNTTNLFAVFAATGVWSYVIATGAWTHISFQLPTSIQISSGKLYGDFAGDIYSWDGPGNDWTLEAGGYPPADAPYNSLLSNTLGHLLKIKSLSNGAVIQGFIKAAGTGETLGDELVNAWTNYAAYPYETFTAGIGNAITQAVNTTGLASAFKNTGSLAGKLIKTVNAYTLTSGSNPILAMANDQVFGAFITFIRGETSYRTGTASTAYIEWYTNASCDFSVSVFSSKQVLTPSATGCTIVSQKGGATFNWPKKDVNFNYADPSGYSYEILKVNNAVEVATGSIDAGNALMDTTTANAFAAPVGVDLSPYQDGKHILAMYQATGAAIGWISATAPSGESLDVELYVDTVFTIPPWIKASANWSIAGGIATHNGSNQATDYVAVGITRSVGMLYKNTITVSAYTSGSFQIYDNSATTFSPAISSSGDKEFYATRTAAAGGSGYTSNATSFNGSITTPSLKRVLDVAATGALLLSTKAGSRGYLLKGTGFDPNAAMTFKVYYVGDD